MAINRAIMTTLFLLYRFRFLCVFSKCDFGNLLLARAV